MSLQIILKISWLIVVGTGHHSRLALILYAPGSVYDGMVEADLAAGTVIVAEEDPKPNLGATAGIAKPSSLSCRRVLPALGNSTFCNTTEGIIDLS